MTNLIKSGSIFIILFLLNIPNISEASDIQRSLVSSSASQRTYMEEDTDGNFIRFITEFI